MKKQFQQNGNMRHKVGAHLSKKEARYNNGAARTNASHNDPHDFDQGFNEHQKRLDDMLNVSVLGLPHSAL